MTRIFFYSHNIKNFFKIISFLTILKLYYLIKTIFRTYILSKSQIDRSCCGVVVITSVLHTEGPQFDPGQQQSCFILFYIIFIKFK